MRDKAATLLGISNANDISRAESMLQTKVDDLDGFKFYLQDEETVLVRASGTEPVLRIYAEASSDERVQVILDKVKQTLISN